MIIMSSKSVSKNYPNVKLFIAKCVIPLEMETMDEVLNLYTNTAVDCVNNENATENPASLDYILFHISPFPGWLDMSNSSVMNLCSDIISNDMTKLFREALIADKIACENIPDDATNICCC